MRGGSASRDNRVKRYLVRSKEVKRCIQIFVAFLEYMKFNVLPRNPTTKVFVLFVFIAGEVLRLHTCMECPNNYPWLLDPTGDGFNFKK